MWGAIFIILGGLILWSLVMTSWAKWVDRVLEKHLGEKWDGR